MRLFRLLTRSTVFVLPMLMPLLWLLLPLFFFLLSFAIRHFYFPHRSFIRSNNFYSYFFLCFSSVGVWHTIRLAVAWIFIYINSMWWGRVRVHALSFRLFLRPSDTTLSFRARNSLHRVPSSGWSSDGIQWRVNYVYNLNRNFVIQCLEANKTVDFVYHNLLWFILTAFDKWSIHSNINSNGDYHFRSISMWIFSILKIFSVF